MPNYVKNIITFADEKSFNKAKELMGDGFDFNKIIEMPKSLNVIAGSIEDDAVEWFRFESGTKYDKDKIERILTNYTLGDETMTYDELIKSGHPKTLGDLAHLGLIYTLNKKHYGHSNWYDWCWDKWGTKWNACDVWWGSNCVEFETAWEGIKDLLFLFATQNNIQFNYKYADENIGYNLGDMDFVMDDKYNISVVDNPIEKETAFAMGIWDMDEDDEYEK